MGASRVQAEEIQQSYLRNFISDITGWSKPEQKLAKAFSQNEFILFGQPIMRLADGGDRRSHLEIFVRLREEEQNLTPPGTFLPILEHYNFGPRLDRYVLHKALEWYERPGRNGDSVMHINLCVGTLNDGDFPVFVDSELKSMARAGDCVCFEIPDVDTLNTEGTLGFVQRLKAAGCRIAIGTVERETILFQPIRHLAPDFVKIGGRLIREAASDRMTAAKVRAAIRACREFGIQTIAQYVEDSPTLELMKRLGADYAQGYGIVKPGPLDAAAT